MIAMAVPYYIIGFRMPEVLAKAAFNVQRSTLNAQRSIRIS